MLEAVHQTTAANLDHVAVPEVIGGVLQITNSAIDKFRANCKDKVAGLLTPHDAGHPITYNHYLTDQVQEAQSERQKKAFEKMFGYHLGPNALAPGDSFHWSTESLINLLNGLVVSNKADMERQAASLAVDYMQAYYKVSMAQINVAGIST